MEVGEGSEMGEMDTFVGEVVAAEGDENWFQVERERKREEKEMKKDDEE